jgi:hypothetical protein
MLPDSKSLTFLEVPNLIKAFLKDETESERHETLLVA